MKKFLILLAMIGLGYCGFAQESSLPNGNFESWWQKPNWGYWEPGGGFFHTLNILDTVPTSCGVSVYRCSDTAYRGTYSARCITRKMNLSPLIIVIPGVLGTLKINWIKSSAILGEKYTWNTKAQRFQGWYQSYPLNGDTTAAIILLSKWNSGTGKRDTIAYNRLVFKGIINQWTKFDTAIQYRNNTVMPDSITVLLLSCAGYDAKNMLGSKGEIGSQAYFDDVTITNVAGIEYIYHPRISVKISPNPSSSYITVETDRQVKNGTFEIYDALGRMLKQYPMNNQAEGRFYVGNLSTGTYYYRFRSSDEVMNTGEFMISR